MTISTVNLQQVYKKTPTNGFVQDILMCWDVADQNFVSVYSKSAQSDWSFIAAVLEDCGAFVCTLRSILLQYSAETIART
jgi:hypothetical protein